MTMGRPVADLDEFLDTPPQPHIKRVSAAPEPAPKSRRVRPAWIILIVTAVVVAVAVAYWVLIRPDAAEPLPLTAPAPTATTPLGVGSFAELYLATYMGGDANALSALFPAMPDSAMARGAFYLPRTATIDVEPAGEGMWSVVVAADVLEHNGDGYEAMGLQFFEVGVADDGGRLVAVTLPARVSGLESRSTSPRRLQNAASDVSEATHALLGDFFEALLTGRRDLARYADPNAGIDPVSPPYADAVVAAAAAYDDGSILVTVDTTAESDHLMRLQYVVSIDPAAGRVTGLSATPPLLEAAP